MKETSRSIQNLHWLFRGTTTSPVGDGVRKEEAVAK
jgi:hypothetical protein